MVFLFQGEMQTSEKKKKQDKNKNGGFRSSDASRHFIFLKYYELSAAVQP